MASIQLSIKSVPIYALLLMGSLDCLTTVIGIFYFGAIEANPFMANMTSTNLPAFTALKLSTTLAVGLLFYGAGKILLRTSDKTSKPFKLTNALLRSVCVILTGLLLVAVINNMLVWIHII
jgi:hypothetical protein